MWWTYAAGSGSAERYPHVWPLEVVLARGTGGQAIFVVPEADLVVVHRGDTDNDRRVSGRDVWTILDRILGAKRGEPGADPRFVAMSARPFSSQAPVYDWPEPVTLGPEAMERLEGRYEFRPGAVGRMFVHQGRPFFFMPGEGEAELFATTDSTFYVRVVAGVTIDFEGGPSSADRVIVRMGGQELVGERLPES